MKIFIIFFLIVMIRIFASESSVYDWHLKTIESDSDFGDALKVETALNEERQQDLFKISGKTKNIEVYPQPYYNLFDSNAAVNLKDANQNFLKDKFDDRRAENSADFSNLIRKQYSKMDNKTKNFDENKFNNQMATTVLDRDEDVKRKINIRDRNGTNTADEFHKNQTTKNQCDQQNKEISSVENYFEKYVDIDSFVGTNLFDSTSKKCFSSEDVALLTIRKDFEKLIPKNLPQSLFDDHMVGFLLNYFYICHQMIIQSSSINSRHLAQKAFYDTLGGYLNFYMVPVTKYSYYAGQISLNTAQRVLNLHEKAKKLLNTNGNGWKAPLQNVLMELKSVYIEPLHIPESNDKDTCSEASFCMQLAMNTDDNQPDNDRIIVQLPNLERENLKGYLGNIWLPFNRKKTFDLRAESSNYLLVKFYEIVTKCYRFENIDQEFYNQQFKIWLLENIHNHLSDEEFYPGLGAVLRICEYLKGHRKNVIGIGNDLGEMKNGDGMYNNYVNHQIKSDDQLHKRRKTESGETKENLKDLKKTNIQLSDDIGDERTKTVSDKDNKLEAAMESISKIPKALLRSLDFTTTQIAIIAVPIVLFIIIICCWISLSTKKKADIPIKLKNSSSSSSNLLNSPVRFFNIKKKSSSAMDDLSSTEAGNKKNKKSVKIEKKPLINSDSSMSSSPIRNKKSKESSGSKDKTKSKESDKSNSKSSWETTFSSK